MDVGPGAGRGVSQFLAGVGVGGWGLNGFLTLQGGNKPCLFEGGEGGGNLAGRTKIF